MNILITGANGFLGRTLTTSLLTHPPSPISTLTLTDLTTPPLPPIPTTTTIRLIAADLTFPSACLALLTPSPPTLIYLLHGLMSSASEHHLDRGMAANFDSVRTLLDTLRRVVVVAVGQQEPAQAPAPLVRIVYTSSCAVYGPLTDDQNGKASIPIAETIFSERDAPRPTSSYGAQKLMCELLLRDYSRRGLVDARIVRLPTILIRPGPPSGAASSFASAIIRDPLDGKKTPLPVPPTQKLWVSSTRTVIGNLIHAASLPPPSLPSSSSPSSSSLPTTTPTINLPGTTITVQDLLDALKATGGEEALARVEIVEGDETTTTRKVVDGWAVRFDTRLATSCGFGDVRGGVGDWVREFLEGEGEGR